MLSLIAGSLLLAQSTLAPTFDSAEIVAQADALFALLDSDRSPLAAPRVMPAEPRLTRDLDSKHAPQPETIPGTFVTRNE